jgi:hypothetical protein
VATPSSPPDYYIVDFATHKAEIVGEQYPALVPTLRRVNTLSDPPWSSGFPRFPDTAPQSILAGLKFPNGIARGVTDRLLHAEVTPFPVRP